MKSSTLECKGKCNNPDPLCIVDLDLIEDGGRENKVRGVNQNNGMDEIQFVLDIYI